MTSGNNLFALLARMDYVGLSIKKPCNLVRPGLYWKHSEKTLKFF
jgi:hypothetical protein